jgi:hypothetical protein
VPLQGVVALLNRLNLQREIEKRGGKMTAGESIARRRLAVLTIVPFDQVVFVLYCHNSEL